MHFYITGDTHGDFSRIAEFCETNGTDADDVMIILGDAGINYYLDVRDRDLKNELTRLPITLFCIHGNHEARPWEAEGNYEEIIWHKGIVYAEEGDIRIMFEDYDDICEEAE